MDGPRGAAGELDAWAPVSAAHPCPCCGATEGCRVATRQAFVLCRAVPSVWPAEGGGWFHRLRAVEAERR